MRVVVLRMMYITLFLAFVSCEKQSPRPAAQASQIHEWNIALEDAIIRDGFSAPVASRIYAYTNLTYFHLLNDKTGTASALSKHLQQLPEVPRCNDTQELAIRAGFGFYFVGKQLVYTDAPLDTLCKSWKTKLVQQGWERERLASLEAESEAFSKEMTAWINADGYPKTRSMPRYTLLVAEGAWQPTPQDYMEALEPHWGTLRPFVLDSTNQMRALGPVLFDDHPKSAFFQQCDSLLRGTRTLTPEQIAIARHWDDNSFVPIHTGHSTSAEKKLTPAGHWMNIARSLAIQNNMDLHATSEMYCKLSMAMADAFLACWEAKYHFQSIRPITVIQDKLDPNWKPLLVTPAFPEYPSGHSVVSGTASTILADIFGADVAFTDSSEVPFGYPPRRFPSFEAAATEASVSRFYGGIHFPKALDDGLEMGEKIAQFHLSQWKNSSPKQ